MTNVTVYNEEAKLLKELAETNNTTEAEILEYILDAIRYDFKVYESKNYKDFNEYITKVFGLNQIN